jgi:hypothetical protein
VGYLQSIKIQTEFYLSTEDNDPSTDGDDFYFTTLWNKYNMALEFNNR